MQSEGASLALSAADPRRYLPYALLATLAVVVLPGLIVLPLAPLEGVADVALSAVLAIGLSVAAGSACSALWATRPESRDVVFGDLLLWRWVRRWQAERRIATAAAELPEGDPLLPALHKLSAELEARDSFMRGHSKRVARHAERIARELGLPSDEVERIRDAALVHDVGKLFLPHAILAYPGRLSHDEFELVKRHAADGAELVRELGDPDLTAIVRHHHERIDGNGYPDGLAGDEIPLGARILAVADTFDALTSERPYRKAASYKSALDVVSEEAGTQLDAGVVAAFMNYHSGKRSIAGAAFVATAPQRLVSWLVATPAGVGAGAPALTQGVCAAGAVALAGVCLGGAPAITGDGSSKASTDAGSATATAQDGGVVRGDETRQAGGPGTRDGSGTDGGGQRRQGAARQIQANGQAPAQDRQLGAAPRSGTGGDGGSGSPVGGAPNPVDVDLPGGGAPGAPTPGIEVPGTPVTPPVSPPKVLDPVVDTVDGVLGPAPGPVREITEPVKDLLGRTGLVTPTP